MTGCGIAEPLTESDFDKVSFKRPPASDMDGVGSSVVEPVWQCYNLDGRAYLANDNWRSMLPSRKHHVGYHKNKHERMDERRIVLVTQRLDGAGCRTYASKAPNERDKQAAKAQWSSRMGIEQVRSRCLVVTAVAGLFRQEPWQTHDCRFP